MRPIQFILIPLLALIVITYLTRFRSRLLDRLIVLSLGTFGIIMILVPDLANSLAHLVGVGRGADLVLYVGLVGLGFLCLILYSKLRFIDAQLVKLARTEAIDNAVAPAKMADRALPDDHLKSEKVTAEPVR